MPRRTTAPSAVLLLGLAAALAACADDQPPPASSSGSARPAATQAAATPPAGPVTTFDGRYTGTLTLNPDRTRRCVEPSNSLREITVVRGRASFIVTPEIRETLSGTVGRDGSVRMSSIVDRAVATTGVFTTETFIGEHRNGLCSYAVNLRKAG